MYEERLKELCMFSLEMRWLRGEQDNSLQICAIKGIVISCSPCPPRVKQEVIGLDCSKRDLGVIPGITF